MSDPAAGATPTVYFIDDSATMREVIKVAFRRENINVVACHDAATALSEIEQAAPDIVITDVIMPDKDGYEVCQFIKQHPRLGKTPVILMSGVVNKAVAEKAFAVKADELIRKPFQPKDLINRVKALMNPGEASAPAPAAPQPVAAPPTAQPPASDKLRVEIQRLQGLVKKLQTELEAEREYGRSLEAQIKNLQGGE